jgi:hypothetical protein
LTVYKEKSHKNILFMPKRSRLEVKKTSVQLSNGKKQKGGQKTRWPNIQKPDTNPAFEWLGLA